MGWGGKVRGEKEDGGEQEETFFSSDGGTLVVVSVSSQYLQLPDLIAGSVWHGTCRLHSRLCPDARAVQHFMHASTACWTK